MPVCYHFLKGICTNENCPYSHVNVNPKAAICEDFLKGHISFVLYFFNFFIFLIFPKGYCPKGEECPLKHVLVCPDFTETGKCPRGTKCKLKHVKSKRRRMFLFFFFSSFLLFLSLFLENFLIQNRSKDFTKGSVREPEALRKFKKQKVLEEDDSQVSSTLEIKGHNLDEIDENEDESIIDTSEGTD